MTRCLVLAAAMVLGAGSASAQTLQQRIDSAAAKAPVTWIEYRVPMLGGSRGMCCFDSSNGGTDCCRRCRLEGGDGVFLASDTTPAPHRIVVEPPSEMRVFARVENRTLTRVRIFSLDCDVDADGVTLVPLTGVAVDDSVAWLAALVRSTSDTSIRLNAIHMPALSALALHPGNAAANVLI